METFDGNIQVSRYDAEGLRHEMEENGSLVKFIFNPDREAVVESDAHNLIRYIRSSELIARNTDAARTYYHYVNDEIGSTTHIVDEDGIVLNHYDYDAWGNLTAQEEAVPNRFKFTGQQLDPVTQQYYLRARFYNPIIARFTQEDTYRGDGLNLYAYCQNNPVFYVDPSGNVSQCLKNAFDKYRQEGKNLNDAYELAKRDYKNAQQQGVSIPAPEEPSNDGFKKYVQYEKALTAELDTKQMKADQAAQKYNHRGGKTPAERAALKGLEGVGTTVNGGATFAGTEYLYSVGEGQRNTVTIIATGSYHEDFAAANAQAGFLEQPTDTVWHHLDNYDVRTHTVTLELIKTEIHGKVIPHSGGCAQYKAVTGKPYRS